MSKITLEINLPEGIDPNYSGSLLKNLTTAIEGVVAPIVKEQVMQQLKVSMTTENSK